MKKIKVGVMGGSFNPFHLAHLNSLLTVREQFSLEKIILIPSFQTPLKQEEELSPVHRLEMLKQAVKSYPFLKVDNQEITRKGVSYTYRTINQLTKKMSPQEELYFIMGLDQFYIFDQWKNWEEILKKTNLIVTSRPGLVFPKKTDDLPKALKPLIKKRLSKEVSLKSSQKKIHFCSLKDMDISASYIRQRLQEGKEAEHLIPKDVDLYIKEQGLYIDGTAHLEDDNTQELLEFSIKELENKQAYDVKSFDLRLKPLPFSFAVIASASNTRQTKALAVHLKRKIKDQFNLKPLGEEGKTTARWIVLDYDSLVIHIFYDYTKKIYKLEELWTESTSSEPPKVLNQ